MVREWTLYVLIPLKFVRVCLVAQNTLCLGDSSMGTWENCVSCYWVACSNASLRSHNWWCHPGLFCPHWLLACFFNNLEKSLRSTRAVGVYPFSICSVYFEKACCCSVAQSRPTLGDPHGLQHARLPWTSPSPEVCSNSCPLRRWCHPTISSSVTPFSCCPQSLETSC